MAMRTILSISQDEELLLSRSEVLRLTDAKVIAARAAEAKKILKERRFDLVVLCHSLSSEDTLEIVGLARHKTVAVPVLKIVSQADPVSEWTDLASDPTAPYKPEVLVEQVQELLNLSPTGRD
jgi:DNA-binding response OmpR family regulator